MKEWRPYNNNNISISISSSTSSSSSGGGVGGGGGGGGDGVDDDDYVAFPRQKSYTKHISFTLYVQYIPWISGYLH